MAQTERAAEAQSAMRHEEATTTLPQPPEVIFDRLDDPTRFGEHMSKPSLMMLGGRMSYVSDEAGGRQVGSVIKMTGSMPGLELSVEEIVRARERPFRKTWETIGRPNLVVIDWYRMGFMLREDGAGSLLTVFIDYTTPTKIGPRLLALLLAPVYARWCVRRIVQDSERAFARLPARALTS
jgi:hypothetical protein